VLLVPDGGRAAIGGIPKSHHNLQLFGAGMLLTGGAGSNKGTLAFSNDGGGAGFQLDYSKGKMLFASLPPLAHLKNKGSQKVHMSISDNGNIGIGTIKPRSTLHIKSDSGMTMSNSQGARWTYRTSKDGALEFTSNKGGYFKVDNQGGMHLSKKTSKYKLEVAGKGMLLTGAGKGKAPLVFGADGGGKGFRMDYFKEKMMFGHGSGVKWNMVMTDSGLVGVGTPAPLSALHVKHDAGIAIEHGSKLQRWTVATAANANLDFSYMGKNKVSFTKMGYVGIGTTAPKKMLHVEGDMWVAGKMHLDNWYTKKLSKRLAAKAKPKLEMLTSAEALLQLDEHMAAKMDDGTSSMSIVHTPRSKQDGKPVELVHLVSVMHRVVRHHQDEIKALKARLAILEKRGSGQHKT